MVKTTNLSQVTDKLEYTSPSTRFELTTVEVIHTDCTVSCKSNYHMITTMTAPLIKRNLNSDGQQFHRYQQNKPSHLTSSVVNNSTDINKTSYHISPQVWSTIPQISTKQAITSHLKSLNMKKITTYDVGNQCVGLGQAQKCGRVKPLLHFTATVASSIKVVRGIGHIFKIIQTSTDDQPSVTITY